MPASLEDLGRCKVNFREFDGWEEDISDITDFNKLPRNAQIYITEVEKELGIPISWIGTGPKREAMLLR
jgi:adenylosuccinate synthase